MDRRVFVKAGGLALLSFGVDPIFLTRAAYAVRRRDTTGARRKTLVCIFQRGAVDGLSMVVPHGDAVYYRERPRIAIPQPGKPGGAIDLDGYFGLHPGLEALLPFFRDESLAIVHAVGSPNASRSHFDAQDYMETGTPGVKTTSDGWLNRHLQHTAAHEKTPFRGVAVSRQLPRVLRGVAPALAIDDLRTFGLRAGQPAMRAGLTAAFKDLYAGSASGLVASSSEEAFEAIRMLESANRDHYSPAHGARYPRGRLGQSLRQIAQLIKADLGIEIAFADVGGWDTHVNQGRSAGQLGNRLVDLGESLSAFTEDLGERMADVAVLTMSEFGRTVAENGTSGTDHGHGTAMLVLGGDTRGGRILGRWPGLAAAERFEGRDLAVTTDFRDLFGEVLVRHLGDTDLASVFPRYRSEEKRWVGVMG